MNFIKNKIKIFIRNIKHLIRLFNEKEIPKKSIYKSNIAIEDFSYFNYGIFNKNPNLLLSSNYEKITTTRMREFNKMFSYLNNFNVFFFNHKDRDKYMKKYWSSHPIYDLYKRSLFQQMKSDVFRYCFIYDNGGYWIDFKSTILFKVDELMIDNQENLLISSPSKIPKQYKFLKDKSIFKFTEGKVINNWVFGAKKKSTFLKYLIENISKDYLKYINQNFPNPKEAILELTGPYKITKMFYKYLTEDKSKINEFCIVNESEYEFHYISDFGRNFKLTDNVTQKHYSNVENKKIIK
tara:strand:- start:1146 stop:2030 length:885 start_codon:yes stop_codon:yes gene_type:complete